VLSRHNLHNETTGTVLTYVDRSVIIGGHPNTFNTVAQWQKVEKTARSKFYFARKFSADMRVTEVQGLIL
jgi:hypothetical protein